MEILAQIINILHYLLVAFVVIVPFYFDHPVILLYYCFIVFFIMVHWYTNNDTCVLTVIESKLRGKKDEDTFMGKLIKPIYNVSSREIHFVTIFLFFFALLKTRLWETDRMNLLKRFIHVYTSYIKFGFNSLISKFNKNDDTKSPTYSDNAVFKPSPFLPIKSKNISNSLSSNNNQNIIDNYNNQSTINQPNINNFTISEHPIIKENPVIINDHVTDGVVSSQTHLMLPQDGSLFRDTDHALDSKSSP